ncbi:hypothetical protein C9F11_38195 [Streptomyces sp. YIM 121038]|uniref:hypothetical protein n=1 Tax=Streptomyces sp. YIM 121038 TaxID=2136401 RepID=UPI0011635194|nr:hypothetical protein [Streptomyces sp. YIM 121038]QCX81222.1 hypothetical protein C9F11_38195 [Streptomyces sp. YIM 121038]
MSPADVAAHEAASYVRRPRRVLARFPAGGPRGSWPAEREAERLRREGVPAEVRMDLVSDSFLVVAEDHGKSKPELPRRPRGPHPYRAVAS